MQSQSYSLSSPPFIRHRVESTHVWRIATLVAVLGNVLVSYIGSRLPFGHGTIGEISARYENAFSPAPYAFAIWGLIYFGFLAYGVSTLRRSQRSVPFHDRMMKPFLAANVLGAAWIVAFKFEYLLVGTAILAAMLVAAWTLFVRSHGGEGEGRLTAPWRAPFALFLGWMAVANLANLMATLVYLGWSHPGDAQNLLALTCLMIASVFAFVMALRFRSALIPLVVCWSAFAIAARNEIHAPLMDVMGITVGVGMGLLFLVTAGTLVFSNDPTAAPPESLA